MSKAILIEAYQPTVYRGVNRALEYYLYQLCIDREKLHRSMFEDVFELACKTPEIKSLYNSVNEGGAELVTELVNNICHTQCHGVYNRISDANGFESIDHRLNYEWAKGEEVKDEQTES